jgi:hypothetical protein
MGFFGTYLFDGTRWSEQQPEDEPTAAAPWLLVDVHDSDIATVKYSPTGPGTGIAYLGFTPRMYFEDDSASAPTDVSKEADGLATWWGGLHPGTDEAERRAKSTELRAFLAADEAPIDTDNGDSADSDDADVFVEIKTARFLDALGLPKPDGLPA